MLLCFLDLQTIYVAVNAASFLESWDSAAHPIRTSCQLIIGGQNWPIQSISQRDQAIDRPHGLSFQVSLCQSGGTIEVSIRMAISVAVGIPVGVAIVTLYFSP